MDLCRQRYVVIFWVLTLFYCWWPYFVVCGFSRTIWLRISSFVVYEDFGCFWVACTTWSGHTSVGPWWARLGMQVLVYLGHEWAWNCWSHKGMFDSSSTGTLTYVKIIETCVESIFCRRMRAIHNSGSFVLFWWGWLGWVLHCIKSPDQRT
jgi:hypothetical protein